jgi:hypothetical protein
MRLLNNNIPTLIYGIWVLRITNDINVDKGLNYIKINEEPYIKFKTIKQQGLFGIKKSRTAIIDNINTISQNSFTFTLNYLQKNTYSYSLLGIEIPEFKSESINYNKMHNLSISILDKTLLITNNNLCLYYIFDLNIGKMNYPNIETSLNTFLFTQTLGILLSILITKLL